jgi:hypothetical protein
VFNVSFHPNHGHIGDETETGITPYFSQNIPRGLLGARTIDSPIHLPACDKLDGIHWYIGNHPETVQG